MTLADSQNLVVKWWHTTRDYNTGTMLLAKYCKNKSLVRTLSLKTEQFGRKKLEYELTKAVHLNHLDMPEPTEESKANRTLDSQTTLQKLYKSVTTSVADSLTQFPKIIRRIKHEYSELYKQRSILHRQMAAVPDVNSVDNNKQRSELFAEIKKLSKRMDFLFEQIKLYDKDKIIPAEDTVWITPEIPIKQQSDVALLTKKRTNLVKVNYKARNLLLYQQIGKAEMENKMPDGPKRQQIELQIKERNEKIEKIDLRLKEIKSIAI